MAKGDVILVPCIGSVGGVVRDFNTKEVIAGSYRHTQTVNGVQYSWKCGALTLNGVVKLVEDEYNGATFYRMEGMAESAQAVSKVQETFESLKNMAW